jgi:signal transduction histidine kinase
VTPILDDIVAYIELDDDDRARLRELHDRLAPHFPAIAERFYAAIAANPVTAALLSGPEQIERLKRMLVDWMSTGLRGPHDDAFYEKRSRIGRRHVHVGLPQHYMFTAMSVIRIAYHDYVRRLYDPEQTQAIARATDKLLDLELAVMMRYYQLDSEERLIERERANARDRLAAMQTLTSGLAHGVRNPLHAARLQLELLSRRLDRRGDDPQLAAPLELASAELARLQALLDDFLAFARPPALQLHDHDLVAIARHAVELEQPLAERRGVAALCRAAGPVVAHVDSEKICQAVQHLARNAIEAAPQGGHVAIDVEMREGVACIRVTDDGPGIPTSVLPRVYEPFFSTKDGTGMGMAIVHSLVTMHGGRLDVATSPTGTRVEVLLPRAGWQER